MKLKIYRVIILPVVLYGSETWSPTLIEKHKLRVLENRVQRKVSEITRRKKCMREKRVVHRVLVGKPEGKRPLGRPRRRWEDNIKMDLQKVGVMGTECSWLRIGTGDGRLWVR